MQKVKKPITARELITSKVVGNFQPLAPDQLAELKIVVAHNDKTDGALRVGRRATIAMLRARGWHGKSEEALNRVCRLQLNRTSFSTP